jgi:predicted MPP superfamily phosphohydrolase
MTLFLLTFFSVYGGVHAYAFWKARAALDFGWKGGLALALFMITMILSPIFVRLSERAGLESLPRVLAYISYFWMGILFVFFSVSLVLDIYRLFVLAAGFVIQRDIDSIMISARALFTISLVSSILVNFYGYFEARDIRTEKILIKTSKIPEGVERIRIVQISDVHIGLIVREERLKRILSKVKEAKPDILISTGDLVDGQINNLQGLAEPLKEIRSRYGKFAVTGNHEYYAGLSHTLDFTKRAGFKVLRGEVQSLPIGIHIAGVDDPTGERYGLNKNITEKELLSNPGREGFTILLKHRPLIDQDAAGLFDLQLSGHVHKGQIFPFNLLTYLHYPVRAGHNSLASGSSIYVSRGTGTWGPPVRFLAPPEVTVIDLMKE